MIFRTSFAVLFDVQKTRMEHIHQWTFLVLSTDSRINVTMVACETCCTIIYKGNNQIRFFFQFTEGASDIHSVLTPHVVKHTTRFFF